jgi:hypothetical protein
MTGVLPAASGTTAVGLSTPVAVAGTVTVAGAALVGAPYAASREGGGTGGSGATKRVTDTTSHPSPQSEASSSWGGRFWGGGGGGGGGSVSAVPEPALALPMLLATVALLGTGRRGKRRDGLRDSSNTRQL